MARIVDLKLRAVGVNGLVKLSKMLANAEQDATFRFRALNQQYKPTLMGKFLTTLKLSCNEKGAVMRPLGHKKIRNSLYVTTGGGGRGISAFQVKVAGEASKFARIYDVGGIISPKAGNQYLAVPLYSLRNLSLNVKGKLPREVLTLLQSSGVKTTTIPLNRRGIANDYQLGSPGEYDAQTGSLQSFSGKLIVGKFKVSGPGQTVKFKQVGLYALIHQVSVKPSYWLRDGTETFITQQAIPLLTEAAQQEAKKMVKSFVSEVANVRS